jgi:hypothetical protein
MTFKSFSRLSILCFASLALIGCDQVFLTHSTDKAALAPPSFRTVIKNANSFGATGTRVGNEAAIIVYSGQARDFITCPSKRSNAEFSVHTALDARTTVVPKGGTLSADTLYVATTVYTTKSGKSSIRMVEFTTTKSGTFDFGVTCRATGKLEQILLARK